MRTILLLLLVPLACAEEVSVDQLFNTAVREQQKGQYSDAIRDYREIIQRRPDMVEAKVNLGATLADSGQYEDAIAIYKAALPSVSLKKPVLMNIARAYYMKGDLERARQQLAEVHQLYPEDQEVTVRLANVDLEAHAPAESVALLQPLDSGNSQNTDFQYLYGTALIASGHPEQGVPRVEQVARAANRADAYIFWREARICDTDTP